MALAVWLIAWSIAAPLMMGWYIANRGGLVRFGGWLKDQGFGAMVGR